MSNPGTTVSKPAAIRRTRYAIQTIALVFAVTACCAFIGVLGDRFPRRLDATATREHQLSGRTLDLLKSLNGDYELVVAANFSLLDQQAARRTQDVLDNFARSSPRIKTTTIDVASSRGLNDLDDLLARLLERFGSDIEKQRQGVASAITAAGLHADSLEALSADLLATRDTVTDGDPNAAELRRVLGDYAATCRILSEDLTKAKGVALEAASKTIGRTPVPATDDAISALRTSISAALSQLQAIGDNVDAVSKSPDEKAIAPATRDRSRGPAEGSARLRRELGVTLAALDSLPRTPISSVLRVLERTSAAIVIGPPGAARAGVTSLELSSIYPPRPPAGASAAPQVDLRARTEELLAGAIASLARADAPIVVLVHGWGTRIGPDQLPKARNLERLSLRGVDFAEWAAGLDSEPPSLRLIDPTGMRPVVYLGLALETQKAEDAARLGKLVEVERRLINEGKRLLVCEVPSTLPSIGQPDPMAEILAPLGVNLDTGRPLLLQQQTPRGREVTANIAIADPQTDHPIAEASRGLVTLFPWAVPVRIREDATGVRPVVVVDNRGKSIWAESEFLGFLQTPAAQQPLLINPPSADTTRDDPAGPWPIVVSIERTVGGTPQRVIVVGSNKWMSGEVIGAEADAEGRRVPAYPGNMELLDACVYWLAGQDAMVSRSPEAHAVPLIPPMTEAQARALKWGLIGGLPLLILLIGALWRLMRG